MYGHFSLLIKSGGMILKFPGTTFILMIFPTQAYTYCRSNHSKSFHFLASKLILKDNLDKQIKLLASVLRIRSGGTDTKISRNNLNVDDI